MTGKQWIIQVSEEINTGDTSTELAKKWVSKVNNELNNLTESSLMKSQRWKKQSIYKVPSSMTDLCSSAYKPETVSIGPYHHGEEPLEAMEEHKHRALLNFLRRSKKPLQCYVDALARVVEDLKDAYSQLDLKWKQDTEAFLELMIVDGCFILELLRTTTAEEEELKHMGYADNDPVFSNHGKLYFVPYLRRDMLMLENQLPMLVLTTLLDGENDTLMINDLSKQVEIKRLILKFFEQPHNISNIDRLGKCLHILDVYRKNLLSVVPRKKTKGRQSSCLCRPKQGHQSEDKYIRSATELNEAGIQFKQSKTSSLNDISFQQGVLKLPLIQVDDTLESRYLNLMAFERFHVGAGTEVSSHVFFLDNIIDSAADVRLLHSYGIIQSALGSDKAVAKLFNSLSRDISLDPDSRLGIVHKHVNEYCRKPWPKWQASLKRTYFTSPWAVISVIAAFFLFALASIQTIFTVLSYSPK